MHETTLRAQFITHAFEFGIPDRQYRALLCGSARFQGQHRSLEGHDIVLLQPGEVWDCTLSASVSSYHRLLVNVDKLDVYVPEDSPGGRRRMTQWAVKRPILTEAFDRLCTAFRSPGVEEIVREHCVHTFVVQVFEFSDDLPAVRQARGCERAVKMARELIEDRYSDALSLTEIAESISLSVYHLERSFAERLGVPIHRYLQLVRVQRCINLLRKGVRPADAWTHCGFSDQAHMTRTFRKTVGLTPGQIAAR